MRPEQVAPFAITLGVVLVAFALMLLGWRRRRSRGAALPIERPDAAALAAARGSAHRYAVQYVATTFADARLDRVAAAGLAFRGRGVLSVLADALVLEVDGAPAVRIPASALRGTGAGTFTIDRVVERDGLQMVTWALGDREVDTALRVRPEDRTALTAAITDLLPAVSAHPADTPTRRGPAGREHGADTMTTSLPGPAVLVLEDGRTFRGRAYGAVGTVFGEAVFATGMTGYQETITDPSYAGQIVVQTAPHIGNTGVNDEDPESRRIWTAGYVVRDPSRVVSNHRATRSLDDDLEAQGVVGIAGVDTRALTRHLRDRGSMRAAIFSGADAALDAEAQLARVRDSAAMTGRNLSAEVSTDRVYTVPATTERIGSVAVLDLGIKTATIRQLAERGFDVHVVPQSITAEELYALEPSAVFYSNGPGDPAASDHHVDLLREVLTRRTPFFGICFGNQLLGRALGFDTVKLPFGHRGINQPVLDRRTGRVEITAQNHGFAVRAPLDGPVETTTGFGRAEVSHISLNDQVVQGLACLDIPAFSVQYHPEAAAGPHDSAYLFDRFRDMVLAELGGADGTAVEAAPDAEARRTGDTGGEPPAPARTTTGGIA